MQEDSRQDIGRLLGLDHKRNGTELTDTSRMENRIVSLRTWWSTSVKVDITVFREPSALERGAPGNHDNVNRIVDNKSNPSDRWESTGRPFSRLWAKVRKSVSSSYIDQTVLQCRSREHCREKTILYDTWWYRTWQAEKFMLRVHITSKWWIILSERMDPWKHEDRSSSGCSRQFSSRPLRNRDHDRILCGDGPCSWMMIVNGINKYVTKMSEEFQQNQIDDMGDSTGQPVAKATPKQTPSSMLSSATVTLPYHQRGWIDVEPAKYDESCFEVSKKMIRLLRHDPSVLREEDGAVELRILAPASFKIVFFALVNSNMTELLAKRRWSQEEIPILRGSQFTWNSSLPSSNSTPLWRNTLWSYIVRQRVVTERVHRAHPPRWKLPRYALDHSIRIDSGWQRRQERETCGVLHGREPNVHWSLQRKEVGRDEAQNCSVQTQMENTPKHSVLV